MPNVLKNVLAFIVGLVAGGAVNMGIILVSPSIIPPPPGVDMTTAEGLVAGMALLEPKHFIAPFLAHAFGTLVSALVGALLAASHRARIAYGLGILSLCGGIAACFMIPAPVWFMALDLIVAYIPMAWLGLMLADRVKPRGQAA